MKRNHEYALTITIFLIVIAFCILLLTSCGGDARGSVHGGNEHDKEVLGLFDHLAGIGSTFTEWGLVVAGLAGVAAFFVPILRPILTLVAEIGGGCAIIGGAFVWISERPILVVLSLIVAGLAYAWWHVAGRRMWLDYRKKPQTPEKVV